MMQQADYFFSPVYSAEVSGKQGTSFIFVDVAQQSQLQLLSKSTDEKHLHQLSEKQSGLLQTATDECGCVKEIVIQTHNGAVNKITLSDAQPL